jgi:hypothetical protein
LKSLVWGSGEMTKLAAREIAALDPYAFMATIGKRVIHPADSYTKGLNR